MWLSLSVASCAHFGHAHHVLTAEMGTREAYTPDLLRTFQLEQIWPKSINMQYNTRVLQLIHLLSNDFHNVCNHLASNNSIQIQIVCLIRR